MKLGGVRGAAVAFHSKKFQFSHGSTSQFQEGGDTGLKSSKVFQRLELKHLKVERVSTLHNRATFVLRVAGATLV